jgi:hypothetical protein
VSIDYSTQKPSGRQVNTDSVRQNTAQQGNPRGSTLRHEMVGSQICLSISLTQSALIRAKSGISFPTVSHFLVQHCNSAISECDKPKANIPS